MAENTLPPNELQALREQGTINENEVAFREGDILVAMNVLTQERRVISRAVTEGATAKRLLKG